MVIKSDDIYKCYTHTFGGSLADGRDHESKVAHSYSGSQPCADCGAPATEHDYEGVLHPTKYPHTPSRCDSCYERLRKEFEVESK